MKIEAGIPAALRQSSSQEPNRREVVAVVLTNRGRIGLFKRSPAVGSDAGRWHCITGFLGEATNATEQAILEINEETGLERNEITSLVPGPTLDIVGGPFSWRVHTFLASTTRRHLELNWEHVSYRWVPYDRVPRFDGQVHWLGNVLSVFRHNFGRTGRENSLAAHMTTKKLPTRRPA